MWYLLNQHGSSFDKKGIIIRKEKKKTFSKFFQIEEIQIYLVYKLDCVFNQILIF